MANSVEYKLGPNTFPRGWFVVAESKELEAGAIAVRFFGQDFVLYRGESRDPIMLDAHCSHMKASLATSNFGKVDKKVLQIEGDALHCLNHGWQYNAGGEVGGGPTCDDSRPKLATIRSYPVIDNMGCIMMWFDPDGGKPEFDAPFLEQWNDSQWVRWELDHLRELPIHPQEILDNMADVRHLGPTQERHNEYFENEFKDHLYIQRQGGVIRQHKTCLFTSTWYTGPGILLSKQVFGETAMYELIANTPVEDGVSKIWHGCLYRGNNIEANDEDKIAAKKAQAGALAAFSMDFNIWRKKAPALSIMQLQTDGPFCLGRKWYSQFYAPREETDGIQEKLNGIHHTKGIPTPAEYSHDIDHDLPF